MHAAWSSRSAAPLLTRDGQGLNVEGIGDWAAQIAGLRQRNLDVVLVTSGAVAAGMQRLGRTTRPHALHELQAMAAVGQMGLAQGLRNRISAPRVAHGAGIADA